MTKLRIAGMVLQSTVDGPGMRYTIFVQGCPHSCAGCHNPSTHDFDKGTEVGIDEIYAQIKRDPLTKGVTFSGGEPFCQAEALAELAHMIEPLKKNILVFSGYTFEQLCEMADRDKGVKNLMSAANYLIDGKFEMEKRDLKLLYRGSSNQRILDITCYPNSKNVREIVGLSDF